MASTNCASHVLSYAPFVHFRYNDGHVTSKADDSSGHGNHGYYSLSGTATLASVAATECRPALRRRQGHGAEGLAAHFPRALRFLPAPFQTSTPWHVVVSWRRNKPGGGRHQLRMRSR
jgi:hypothetical protein